MITITIPYWFGFILIILVLLHMANVGLDVYNKYLENEIVKEENKYFKSKNRNKGV